MVSQADPSAFVLSILVFFAPIVLFCVMILTKVSMKQMVGFRCQF